MRPTPQRHTSLIGNLVRGALIGIVETIPGISGGTVALVVGIYQQLIESASAMIHWGISLVRGRRAEAREYWSHISWRLLIPLGPANTARIGGAAAAIGGLLYLFLRPEHGPWWVAGASFAIGVAMGFTNTSSIVSIQSTVRWERRASATAANLLMRLLGNSVGAALLGGVLNASIVTGIEREGVGDVLSLGTVERLLNPAGMAVGEAPLPEASMGLIRRLLAGGIEQVFVVTFVAAAVLFVLSMLWPRSRRLE